MATRSGPNRLRAPALRGGIVVDTYRGTIRVRAWPRKRGTPKSPATLFQNAWFKNTMQLLKYVDGRAMDWAIKQTKGTGIYPRDLLTTAMTRGLFTIPDPERGLLTPRPLGVWSVAFQGCRLELTSGQAVTAFTNHNITWDTAILDSVGLFDPTAPGQITIPPGVNIVRLTCRTRDTGGVTTTTQLTVNSDLQGDVALENVERSGNVAIGIDTGPLPVSQGEVLKVVIRVQNNCTLQSGPQTNLGVEIIDASLPFNP